MSGIHLMLLGGAIFIIEPNFGGTIVNTDTYALKREAYLYLYSNGTAGRGYYGNPGPGVDWNDVENSDKWLKPSPITGIGANYQVSWRWSLGPNGTYYTVDNMVENEKYPLDDVQSLAIKTTVATGHVDGDITFDFWNLNGVLLGSRVFLVNVGYEP